ncbi:MAG: hypothetical protein AAF763_13705 [Pseudomonadota bacterium]
MEELDGLSVRSLLRLHAQVHETLRDRGVLRSANAPTADLAEFLFCEAFGWELAGKSEKSFDAVGPDDRRYQIKGRRLHRRNLSRQLSAIRDFKGFDVLAGVLFDEDYGVQRAALIPSAEVEARSTWVAHTNSWRFLLRESLWELDGVVDVTEPLRAALEGAPSGPVSTRE